MNGAILATEVVVAVGVTIAIAYEFMQLTHVLWVPLAGHMPGPLLKADAQHHLITVLAMLWSGLVAMFWWVAPRERTWAEQSLTLALLPLPLLAAMSLAIASASHRALALTLLTLLAGCAAFAPSLVPRLGPRAVLYGTVLVIGFVFGMGAGARLRLGNLPSVGAIIYLAVVVNIALRGIAVGTVTRGSLRRSTRSFVARARSVAGAAATILSARDARAGKRAALRLGRAVARCNETALVIDGQLVDRATTLSSAAPWALHEDVFELELSVDTIGQESRLLAPVLDPRSRAEAVAMLKALHVGDDTEASRLAGGTCQPLEPGRRLSSHSEGALTSSLAAAVIQAADAAQRLADPAGHLTASDAPPFQSPIELAGGRLPGSKRAAAATSSSGTPTRLTLPPAARGAVQVLFAVGAACLAGSALSSSRFYWAVIAVFVALTGVNTAGEQLTRAIGRLAGTFVGIVIGALLADAMGPTTWSLAVILAAIGLGLYLRQLSYALFTTGVTIAVTQIYAQIVKHPDGLLALRLEETAIGIGVAAVAALVIFPVSTDKTARTAVAMWIDALSAHIDVVRAAATGRPCDPSVAIGTSQRALDDRFQQVLAAVRPLSLEPLRPRRELRRRVGLMQITGYWARFLGSQVQAASPTDPLKHELSGLLDELQIEIGRLKEPPPAVPEADQPPALAGRVLDADAELGHRGLQLQHPARQLLGAILHLQQAVVELTRLRAETAGTAGS